MLSDEQARSPTPAHTMPQAGGRTRPPIRSVLPSEAMLHTPASARAPPRAACLNPCMHDSGSSFMHSCRAAAARCQYTLSPPAPARIPRRRPCRTRICTACNACCSFGRGRQHSRLPARGVLVIGCLAAARWRLHTQPHRPLQRRRRKCLPPPPPPPHHPLFLLWPQACKGPLLQAAGCVHGSVKRG